MIVLIGVIITGSFILDQTSVTEPAVMGNTQEQVTTPTPDPNITHFDPRALRASATQAPVESYEVALVSAPQEIMEGDIATFTWQISGYSNTIHTTSIYYGTTNQPGTLTTTIQPAATLYTDMVKEFMQGDYPIPFQFVGNAKLLTPGTYFYRAYALIDGNHYWSAEGTFVVKPIPKHEIKIVNPPGTISHGGIASFTWDVYGPSATTWYSVIVVGTTSHPGTLDASVDLSKTPYTVLVNDFASGTYAVPLRFIGSAIVKDPGVYYFRALVYINGKNIWSDEYSFTVE